MHLLLKESLSVYCKNLFGCYRRYLGFRDKNGGKDALKRFARIVLPGEKEILNEPPLERVFPDIRENDLPPRMESNKCGSRAFVIL